MGGDLVQGEFIDPAQARARFDDWAEAWWKTTNGLRPSTMRDYRGNLDRHVLPYFTGRKVGSIDYASVELFLADCRQKGLGPKVVRECLSVLSLILKFAVKARALSENPASGHDVIVRRRKLHAGDGVLSMEQVHQLIAEVPERYKPAVWLRVFAGLRPAELCGLRVRDVDFIRHEVSVPATLMPVHRYGDEPYRARVEGPPKTDAGDRTIPIPAWLCNDLARMLTARSDANRDSFLFQTRYRNALNRDHFREAVVRPALRAADLPDTIRTYDLRHSHASLLIHLGADPVAVAQRIGRQGGTSGFNSRHLHAGVLAK